MVGIDLIKHNDAMIFDGLQGYIIASLCFRVESIKETKLVFFASILELMMISKESTLVKGSKISFSIIERST